MPSIFTDRRQALSDAPYDSFNLALHVGDDPKVVGKNRQTLSLQSGPVQFMNQVHGNSFAVIDSVTSAEPTCDALITTTPGVALAVLVADCIPLLLSSKTVVAAVHVGRKGLDNFIALKVIEEMRRLGSGAIHAQLGASICGSCYEVPASMAQDISQTHPVARSQTQTLTPALNLPRALIADLVAEGLTYEASTDCTYENPRFFSYRRRNITGRNAGVIWL